MTSGRSRFIFFGVYLAGALVLGGRGESQPMGFSGDKFTLSIPRNPAKSTLVGPGIRSGYVADISGHDGQGWEFFMFEESIEHGKFYAQPKGDGYEVQNCEGELLDRLRRDY